MAMPTKFGRKFLFIMRSVCVRLIACKITKKLKNIKIFEQKSENLRIFVTFCTFAANFDEHMKRIQFISPLDFLTGNISGSQDLEYPDNNNKAFYSPLGTLNYAKNYQPRFIAYQIRQSNRRYFNIRTKTAFHATTRAMKAVSLLGGAGAMYASLLNNKSTTTYQQIHAQWEALRALGMTDTFRQYVMGKLRAMIVAHAEDTVFSGPATGQPSVINPWFEGSQTSALLISESIIVKFWTYLAENGSSCTIDNATCVFKMGDNWSDVLNSDYDFLNLTGDISSSPPKVKMGSRWLKNPSGTYVSIYDAPIPGGSYTTTDIQP